jgi:hypothetical protein
LAEKMAVVTGPPLLQGSSSNFPGKVGFMGITLISCEGKVLQPSSLVRSSNYGQFLQDKAEAANSRIPLCFCADLLLE